MNGDHRDGQRSPTDNPTELIKRRTLLTSIPLASAWLTPRQIEGAGQDPKGRFGFDSPTVLQNPTPDGMTVAWAVNGRATGWIEYGPSPEELNRRAISADCGLVAIGSRFLSARICGLKAGEKVFYRVVSAPVDFRDAYDIRRGEAVFSATYHFATPDIRAETASFAVINDTHENADTLKKLMRSLAADEADYLVWNGDVFNDVRGDDHVVEQVLRPVGTAYAATRPVLFTSGNHDVRGTEARRLACAFTHWPGEAPLGRCFALRHGPLAIIGLDTGEDKPDVRPVFAGLADFEQYRRDQRDWLAKALRRSEIASAPFLIICCHIPLNGLPGQNGGDTDEDFARYAKQSQELWGPVIKQAGSQLVISGHTHRHRYDPPGPERPWGQLVGGGPESEHATLIRGHATSSQLTITACQLDGNVLGQWQYPPRVVY